MDPSLLPLLLGLAVLLPLASFFVILLAAKWLEDKAAWVATAAILGAATLSFISLLGIWLPRHLPADHHAAAVGGHAAHDAHAGEHEGGDATHEAGDHTGDARPPTENLSPSDQHPPADSAPKTDGDHSALGHAGLTFVALQQPDSPDDHPPETPAASEAAANEAAADESSAAGEAHHGEEDHAAEHHAEAGPAYTGEYYTLGSFGPLRITISYYIDSLTLVMFCMVTFIATCIHFYAIGYMHDELSDVTDAEVTLSSGELLKRPGRFPRFFQYLSLFCFSMLGLVLAGNIAMVFVFWELVGICSYFLIGFYIERKSASNAANKAFIVNRVGDFGMIIGLMVIWSTLGTFAFGDITRTDGEGHKTVEPGIFSLVRPGPEHALIVPASMVVADAHEDVGQIVRDHRLIEGGLANAEAEIAARVPAWREQKGYGYWLLVLAGLGIFCGCVGKSAQFPLHVWLPDAMEGPTPVSALVHSATMVAAGVYLVGRFYPVFTPEVLLVIAVIGTITMLLAASIAFTAYDIKRVLAYSTVSQLGLMMLALGVGGWLAGMMHLVTHAFFKSLLFMCSGSVIHAVHTNDMRRMGGLFWKMPVTAITMLIGCLAIAGVAVPFVVGFAGHYSKDAILEQSLAFWRQNEAFPLSGAFFVLALFGAALTTCYMFRMWFMTFVGHPRDEHAYDHAHESPSVMALPLVVLAVLAVSVAWHLDYIGYALIAAGFFIAQGVQQGWFKRSAAHAHAHGHDDHGHPPHDAHAQTAHVHPAHGAAADTHHEHHQHTEPVAPQLTWGWVVTMLICTVVGGWLIQQVIGSAVAKGQLAGFARWEYGLSLQALLEQSRPAGTAADQVGAWLDWKWPNEHWAHESAQYVPIVVPATLLATGSWVGGILIAAAFFWWGVLNPDDVRRQFAPVYSLLSNKWWFDELYDFVFVRPAHVIARMIASFDRQVIDRLLDGLASATARFSRRFEYVADQSLVDGLINLLAGWTYSLGLSLRAVQTGRLRQYVMFIALGAIAIFVLISFFWSPTLAR